MTKYPDWFISKIEQFVNIGFFDKTDDNTLKAILERIIKESEKSYFGNILDLKEDPHLDQILVSYDRKRVWFVEDWLSYGLSQDDFYAKVFAHLSEISEGIINTKNIKIEECGYCDGRDKRLTVFFRIKEKAFNVNFCTDGTVLTLKFLEEINEFLAPQKCSFEYIFDVYGWGFIFFITQSQKDYLTNISGWKFNKNSGYWLDRAQFCQNTGDNENAEKYFKKAIGDSYDYYFVISEFGRFLKEQNKQNDAIEIYEKGIKQLKSIDILNEREKWWLSSLEDDFKELNKKGSH